MSTRSGKSKIIKTNQEQSDQRLDRFLVSEFPEISRTKWQKSVKNERITVNGKISKSDRLLREGDLVEISEQEEKETVSFKVPDIKIIYENDNAIIIDKPAGIPVHSASSYSGPTVVDFLVDHYPEIKNVGEDKSRPGIVHRLDKDTSGVLIAAKNNDTFQFLKDQFKNRLVQKTYTALVYGNVPDDRGAIGLSIGRSRSNPKMQTAIDSKKKSGIKSRDALTLYGVKKRFDNYTLLEAIPKTGRMHQIRVHFKALGFPIAGDKKYFSKKYAKIEPKPERQFLHAGKFEIELPALGKKTFTSKIPEDLAEFLDKIS